MKHWHIIFTICFGLLITELVNAAGTTGRVRSRSRGAEVFGRETNLKSRDHLFERTRDQVRTHARESRVRLRNSQAEITVRSQRIEKIESTLTNETGASRTDARVRALSGRANRRAALMDSASSNMQVDTLLSRLSEAWLIAKSKREPLHEEHYRLVDALLDGLALSGPYKVPERVSEGIARIANMSAESARATRLSIEQGIRDMRASEEASLYHALDRVTPSRARRLCL